MAAQAKQVRGEIPGSGPAQVLHVPIDTAEILFGWKKFYEERREKYQSNVFRTAVGFPAITILDNRGFRALFDVSLVKKVHTFGLVTPRRELVGVIPTISTNAPAHDGQKAFILEWLRRSATRLLPSLQAATEPYLAAWEKALPEDWEADADAILSNALFDFFLGAHPNVSDLEDWVSDVLVIFPFDGPQLPASHKSVAGRDRMLAAMMAAPHFEEAAALGASMAGLSRDETAHHLLFYIGFNAWTGIRGAWRSLMAEIGSRPDTQARLHAEAAGAADPGWPSFQSLAGMEVTRGCLNETLRLHGPVPFAYGEALKDFHIDSSSGLFPVRTGEVLQGVFLMAGRDPDVFPNPDEFDPLRYRDPVQGEGLIWANGLGTSQPTAQNKMCAGRDIVNLILTLFTARLASQYRFELTETPEWDFKNIVPANTPKHKLALKSFQRIG